MSRRRIDTTQSRTAEITCGCRASSFMEKDPALHSDDWVAKLLLPRKLQVLFKVPPVRRLLVRVLGPQGIYEWVIARTKYAPGKLKLPIDQPFEEHVGHLRDANFLRKN